MATPSTAPAPLTGDPFIDAATHGYYWQLDGSRMIRWSVAGGLDGEFWTNPTQVASQMSLIFQTISHYANVRFEYAGSYANPIQAAPYSDITISLSGSSAAFPSPLMWGRAFFPDAAYNGFYQGAPGDVFLNVRSQANFLSSYAPGSAGYFLFLHELGHALGLKHPHDSGGTGHPTLTQIGHPELDKDWFSIMSYEDDYNYNLSSWDPASPMVLDVLALQHLFGKNMATNAGDTTFTLPINNLYATVWDASGNDTVELSGSTQGWVIALPDITPSKLVDTKIGLAFLANEVSASSPTTFYWLAGDIENVSGSNYIDALAGSSGNNFLRGGGANDFLDGGLGIDTAFYSLSKSSYVVTKTAQGATVRALSGSEGTDTLQNIELLRFSGSMVSFDIVGSAGQAYRLYQAALNRTPDLAGVGFQKHALDVGFAIQQIAQDFINSPEFQTKYGTNLTNAAFVTQLYSNVLHRAPDAGGFAYQVNALNSGLTRAQLLVNFSESPENYQATLVGIQNGIEFVPVA